MIKIKLYKKSIYDSLLSAIVVLTIVMLVSLIIVNIYKFMKDRAYEPSLPMELGMHIEYMTSIPGDFRYILPTTLGNYSELRIFVDKKNGIYNSYIVLGICKKKDLVRDTLQCILPTNSMGLVGILTAIVSRLNPASLLIVGLCGLWTLGNDLHSEKCYNAQDLVFEPIAYWDFIYNDNFKLYCGKGFKIEYEGNSYICILRPGYTTDPKITFVNQIILDKNELYTSAYMGTISLSARGTS